MGELILVQGVDGAGTTMLIYYNDGMDLRLLGSASNTTSANMAQDGLLLASYAALVYIEPGEDPANIVVYNQAGTI